MKLIIATVFLVALGQCGKAVQPTSDEPSIGLTLSPQSGKSPLVVEADIDVKNGTSCRLILVVGGLESRPDDIACKIRVTRTFTANGAIKVTTKDAKGKEYVRSEPVTIQ